MSFIGEIRGEGWRVARGLVSFHKDYGRSRKREAILQQAAKSWLQVLRKGYILVTFNPIVLMHSPFLFAGERDARSSERRELPCLGRGRTGETATALEVVHPVHGRHRVRPGLGRRGAHGGGEDGTGADGEVAGERGSADPDPGEQAGPAWRARAEGVGEAVGTAGTGRIAARVAHTARLRHHGRRPPRGHGGAVRDDPQATETRETVQEEDQIELSAETSAVESKVFCTV